MKKGFGLLLLALVSAAAGAAATIFALKKRDEMDSYDYDEDDEKFFEDCDCEECDCCDGEAADMGNLSDDLDDDVDLSSFDDEIEDNDQPEKSDF